MQVAKDIHDTITANGLDSGLLAASFKNSQQVLELTKYGVKAVTVAPDVIDGLVKNAAIDAAVDQFTRDFSGLVGEGKTIARQRDMSMERKRNANSPAQINRIFKETRK